MRWAVALLPLLALSGPAVAAPRADPASEAASVEEVADAVVAAFTAKVPGRLAELASADVPDPWLVADELCARGQPVAASAFARASPRPDVERLPAYVTARRGAPDDAASRAAIAAAEAALAAGRAEEALAALDAAPPPKGTVTEIRQGHQRGMAFRAMGRRVPARVAFAAAGDAAAAIGWLAEAAQGLLDAGLEAWFGDDVAAAIGPWERSLAIQRQRRNKEGVAGTLHCLARALAATGRCAKAIDYEQLAVVIRRELGLDLEVGASLRLLVSTQARLGNLDRALEAGTEALELYRANGREADVADVLVLLGEVHLQGGDAISAVLRFCRALDLRRRLGDAAGVGAALVSLARGLAAHGEGATALRIAGQGRSLLERVGDASGVGGALLGEGEIRLAQGDCGAAQRLFERALAASAGAEGRAGALAYLGAVQMRLGAYRKAYDLEVQAQRLLTESGDRVGLAVVLGTLGEIHRLLGEPSKALDFLERARNLAAHSRAGRALATICTNAGNVYFSLGDYAAAGKQYEQALSVCEKAGLRADAATARGNLGAVRAELGDFDGALVAQREARATFEALGDGAGVARALGNEADVHLRLGKPREALLLLDRAREMLTALKDRRGVAETLVTVGQVERAIGDPEAAREAFRKAEAEAASLGALDVRVRGIVGLAQTSLDLGKSDLALATARGAIPYMDAMVRDQGEETGARARSRYADLYDVGARAAAAEGDVDEAAFFLESGRCGTLLESLGGRASLVAAVLPADLREAESKAREAEMLALHEFGKAVDGGETQAVHDRQADLDAARQARKDLIERMQRERKAEVGVFFPRAPTVEEMQGWLAPGDALVVYGLLSTEAVALVLTRDTARVRRLGGTSAVESACAALRPSDEAVDPTAAVDGLRRLVAAPLALPESVERVLVSPDGELSYVPMALLFPGRVVAYVPSGTTYGLLLDEKDKRGDQVLALGDPDYVTTTDSAAVSLVRRGLSLTPIHATRDEAKAVGDVVLLDVQATEANLRATLALQPRWRAIHLACHGLVDVERPMSSSLALTAEGSDDGLISVLDVFRMKVPADLAVLSACETGKGAVIRGEGIVGLVRAFMYAGAPRVVASLWKVDDDATQALMAKFYELWRGGTRPAQALALAQRHVREMDGRPRWRHPKYWAAWVLWGLPD